MPALLLEYVQPSQAAAPEFLQGIEDLPHGVDFSRSQWVDLDGEGLSGLLTEAGRLVVQAQRRGRQIRRLEPPAQPPAVPLGAVQLGDIDGDGRLEVMVRARRRWFLEPLRRGRVGTQDTTLSLTAGALSPSLSLQPFDTDPLRYGIFTLPVPPLLNPPPPVFPNEVTLTSSVNASFATLTDLLLVLVYA